MSDTNNSMKRAQGKKPRPIGSNQSADTGVASFSRVKRFPDMARQKPYTI